MTTFETDLLRNARFPTDGRVFDEVTIVRKGQWPNVTALLICKQLCEDPVFVDVDMFGESASRAVVKGLLAVLSRGYVSDNVEIRAFCSDGYPILVCACKFAQDNSGVWDMESDREEVDSPENDIDEEEVEELNRDLNRSYFGRRLREGECKRPSSLKDC